MHLLVALITLVVFQMLGGITDFYRSWRGVRAATEFALLLQNWTLSVIFSAGLVAFSNDFGHATENLAGVVCADQHRTGGLPFSGALGRAGCVIMAITSAWSRWRGFSRRANADGGFRNQPWLGFEVVGVYHDRNRAAFLTTGRVTCNSWSRTRKRARFITSISRCKCATARE